MNLTKLQPLISVKLPSDTKTVLAKAAGLTYIWVSKRKDAKKSDEAAAMMDLRYPFIQAFGATTASSLLDAPPSEDRNETFHRMFLNAINQYENDQKQSHGVHHAAPAAVPTVAGLN